MSENQQTENQTPEALTQDARASENQTAKIQTEELQTSEYNDLPEKTAKHSHTDELWKFISETRKISVPIIVAVYTVIVVFITLSAQYAYDVFTIKEEQQISIEDIITADEEEYFLEKDTETEISETITVMYRGYDFKNTVTAQNADEFIGNITLTLGAAISLGQIKRVLLQINRIKHFLFQIKYIVGKRCAFLTNNLHH